MNAVNRQQSSNNLLRIDGNRITVHRIATLYKQGLSAEEISQSYFHLTLGQVYAALTYYHTNRELIETQLVRDDALFDELKLHAK